MGVDLEDVRSWSDAPEDVLAVILSKLDAGDACDFYRVCKTWSRVARVVVERTLSDEEICTCPCLIFPDNRFFHPWYNTWFQMDTIPALPRGVILAQKFGWLLMTLLEQDSFFYNPFTGERIDFPDYYLSPYFAFSAPPTSSECEVVHFLMLTDHQIVVYSIKRGEEESSAVNVCRCKTFQGSFCCKTAFFQGNFFWQGENGGLVIYNPNKKRHHVTGSPRHLWRHFSSPECGRYLFEGEGDLWAVFVALQGLEVCVCKFDLNNLVWERVHNLGDKMIFLSYQSCMMERARVKGAGNKIYFPKLMGGKCLFYSLATKRYHTVEKGSSYDSFRGSKDMPQCTWINMNVNPVPSQTDSENLVW